MYIYFETLNLKLIFKPNILFLVFSVHVLKSFPNALLTLFIVPSTDTSFPLYIYFETIVYVLVLILFLSSCLFSLHLIAISNLSFDQVYVLLLHLCVFPISCMGTFLAISMAGTCLLVAILPSLYSDQVVLGALTVTQLLKSAPRQVLYCTTYS